MSTRSLGLRFLIGLVAGLIVGVVYGWLVEPVQYVDTAPSSLRADYRTDYVLMVAEAYSADGDPALAQMRLASLGPQPPIDIVVDAMQYGIDHNFGRADLETLNQLASVLRIASPTAEITSP